MFNGSKKLDFYIQTILKFKLNYNKENKKKLSFKSAKIIQQKIITEQV